MKYIKYLIITLGLLLSIYLIISINKLNIIPNKYILIVSLILLILNTIGTITLIKKNKPLKILTTIIYTIILLIFTIGMKYINNTNKFFKEGFNNNNIEIKKYNILLLRTSKYNEIEDLTNTGYLNNIIENETYLEQINIKEKLEYKSINELYEDLINKKIESMIIDESFIDLLEDEYKDIKENTKLIYSFDIKKELETKKESSELKPINIYISGSDSRSGLVEASSRTDVNMIMTINPNTKTILLTSIPRDYYVRLHGTTGYKDKLTHSGIYGIEMSKKTIEDLFNIKIDYTIKVGFSSVINLVDLIDGIDIISDKTLTTHSKDGGAEKTYIKEGLNHLTGPQALSYARERYAYIEGDNHRIQNQQQVLEAILEKAFKSKTILKEYEKFLEEFKNLYRTDIPESLIKKYIKEQLNNNAEWKIEKQVVTGIGDSNITYSMPGRYLYVMIPNMNSVEKAKNNIDKIKGE